MPPTFAILLIIAYFIAVPILRAAALTDDLIRDLEDGRMLARTGWTVKAERRPTDR